MSILDLIRRLLGRPKSIDSIVRPMNKIVSDLETYSKTQTSKASRDDAKAKRLAQKATAEREAASSATALAANYKQFLKPEPAK
jgi:hypothetical protein